MRVWMDGWVWRPRCTGWVAVSRFLYYIFLIVRTAHLRSSVLLECVRRDEPARTHYAEKPYFRLVLVRTAQSYTTHYSVGLLLFS